MTSALEREARRRWLGEAADWRYGRCHICGRTHGEDGRPLLVARLPRSRKYQCLDCFEERR